MKTLMLMLLLQQVSIPYAVNSSGFQQNEFTQLNGIATQGQLVPVDFVLSSGVTGELRVELLIQNGPHNTSQVQGDYPYDQYVVLQPGTSAYFKDGSGNVLGPTQTQLGVISTSKGWAGAVASLNTSGAVATVLHWDLRLPTQPGALNISRMALIGTATGAPPPPPPPPPPDPPQSTLVAFLLGTTGEDLAGQGQAPAPNGVVDWHLKLQGLRGTPTKITVTTNDGGIWEMPPNTQNWVPVFNNPDLFIEPFMTTTGLRVTVTYADNTTDTTLAVPPPPPPANPCVTSPLVVTGLKWPGAQTGSRSLSWNSSTRKIVGITYTWNIGTSGPSATFKDDRGCTVTVKK